MAQHKFEAVVKKEQFLEVIFQTSYSRLTGHGSILIPCRGKKGAAFGEFL